MTRGTVKWFNDEKGWGFIKQADGAPDVFFHYSQLTGFQEGERRRVFENNAVEFEIEESARGLIAKNVRRSP